MKYYVVEEKFFQQCKYVGKGKCDNLDELNELLKNRTIKEVKCYDYDKNELVFYVEPRTEEQ